MNDSTLEAWFARARRAAAEPVTPIPPGFAQAVWGGHLRQQAQGRALAQTSAASLGAALLILATVIGWGLGETDRAGDDPLDDVPGLVWDIAAN